MRSLEDYATRRAVSQLGYNFWRLNEDEYELTKNESGTYGEYFDFRVCIVVNALSKKLINYRLICDDNRFKEPIKHIIDANKDLDYYQLSIVIAKSV
jgi:hypothetical protein